MKVNFNKDYAEKKDFRQVWKDENLGTTKIVISRQEKDIAIYISSR